MVEGGRKTRLTDESISDGGILGNLGSEELKGDFSTEARVIGEIDGPIPPRPSRRTMR